MCFGCCPAASWGVKKEKILRKNTKVRTLPTRITRISGPQDLFLLILRTRNLPKQKKNRETWLKKPPLLEGGPSSFLTGEKSNPPTQNHGKLSPKTSESFLPRSRSKWKAHQFSLPQHLQGGFPGFHLPRFFGAPNLISHRRFHYDRLRKLLSRPQQKRGNCWCWRLGWWFNLGGTKMMSQSCVEDAFFAAVYKKKNFYRWNICCLIIWEKGSPTRN